MASFFCTVKRMPLLYCSMILEISRKDENLSTSCCPYREKINGDVNLKYFSERSNSSCILEDININLAKLDLV